VRWLLLIPWQSANEDDFEVVPAEPEEDGIEWDVEDEDQDVVKQEKIKSKWRVL
jgi:AdoMet-dependent rRNA methyltransferase SPB1